MFNATMFTGQSNAIVIDITMSDAGSLAQVYLGLEGVNVFRILVFEGLEGSVQEGLNSTLAASRASGPYEIDPSLPLTLGFKCPNLRNATFIIEDGQGNTTALESIDTGNTLDLFNSLSVGEWNRMDGCETLPSFVRPRTMRSTQ